MPDCLSHRTKTANVDTEVAPAQSRTSVSAPRWVDALFVGLVIYASVCAVLMLAGIGGETATHLIGLLSDSPACLMATLIAAAAARRSRSRLSRRAWACMSMALALYFIGTLISMADWLRDIDPFPGVSDIFFIAFYPAMLVATLLLIRAAAIRVPWIQLALDATIFVVGFGAFFWFLVIRPANAHTEVDAFKQGLSQAYAGLDCVVLLLLGVLLLTGAEGRRVPLLLMAGFAIMFLADILWSVAKISGYYMPGDLQDVLYLICYVPMAAAGREQMRISQRPTWVQSYNSDALTRTLPYAAMLTAFLVLVYFTRDRYRWTGRPDDHGRLQPDPAFDGAAEPGSARRRTRA